MRPPSARPIRAWSEKFPSPAQSRTESDIIEHLQVSPKKKDSQQHVPGSRNPPRTKLTTPHARCTRLVGNQKSGGLKSAGLVDLCIDGNRLKESWVSGYVLFPCQPRLYNTHAHHTLTHTSVLRRLGDKLSHRGGSSARPRCLYCMFVDLRHIE
jgi:hypothetical protein